MARIAAREHTIRYDNKQHNWIEQWIDQSHGQQTMKTDPTH